MFEFLLQSFLSSVLYALSLLALTFFFLLIAENPFSSSVCFALYKLQVLKMWPSLKIRFWLLATVVVELSDLDVGERMLRLIEWPWQRWIPISLTALKLKSVRVEFSLLTLETTLTGGGFLLSGSVTHPAEWNRAHFAVDKLLLRVAHLIKHRYINFLMSMVTDWRTLKPRLGYGFQLVDLIIQRLGIDMQGGNSSKRG